MLRGHSVAAEMVAANYKGVRVVDKELVVKAILGWEECCVVRLKSIGALKKFCSQFLHSFG